MRFHVIAGCAFAGILIAAAPASAVPDQLGLTARVTDGGTPITGNHAFQIRIFDAASNGAQVWTETDNVAAQNGLVYLTLGDQTPLDANVLDGGPLWVELQVDATVLSPRLPITSAAYAVRAGVAEDAERLGGQPIGAFLPKGATLACAGTDKVTGINGASGSVVCAPDVNTQTTYTAGLGLALSGTQFNASFAGSGVANTIARSDHNHNGVYVPVAATGRACTGTNKVTGLNVDGTVACGVDVDTDTNTMYSAGAGLTLSGTAFNVSFAGNGLANSAARSDHRHLVVCPAGYTQDNVPNQNAAMCSRLLSSANVSWYNAARSCGLAGAHLCTFQDVMTLRALNGQTQIPVSTWLGDRTGDDMAIIVNVAIGPGTSDNFDLEVNTTNTNENNYLCCLHRDWP